MEQVREDSQQQEPQTPMRCPRCGSTDTIFRYFNNYSTAQPRYHCRICKRQWTVGGNFRDIPLGSRTKNKASSSRSQPPQPSLPLGEVPLQNSEASAPTGEAIVPQNVDTTMLPQATDTPAAISPLTSYHFNDDIVDLNAVKTWIPPELMNQPPNSGYQICSGSENMEIPQNWNTQTMLSQEVLPQQVPMPIETYQTHNQANDISPYPYINSMVQPTLPVSSIPQDNNFNFAASDGLWNHHDGNSSERESDTASVNVDEWLDFSGYDSSSPSVNVDDWLDLSGYDSS